MFYAPQPCVVLYSLSMRILGIDPGLATVGLGLIEVDPAKHIKVVEWLTISTSAGRDLGERLKEIHDDLSTYLEEMSPDLACIEKLFFATNTKTAIDVAQARGCILQCTAAKGIAILEPTPLQLKICITGDGKASKEQMQQMIQRSLSLPSPPEPDDAADALGLALYGAWTAALHRSITAAANH